MVTGTIQALYAFLFLVGEKHVEHVFLFVFFQLLGGCSDERETDGRKNKLCTGLTRWKSILQQSPVDNSTANRKLSFCEFTTFTSMVLYMIGLGLGDEDDITVKGLKVLSLYHFFFRSAILSPQHQTKFFVLDYCTFCVYVTTMATTTKHRLFNLQMLFI